MPRLKNIRYDAQKLDADIRLIDGDRYSQTSIGTIIMGKGSTYYFNCLSRGTIPEEILDRTCRFYKLKKKDYIIKDDLASKKNAEKSKSEETPVAPVAVAPTVVNVDMQPMIDKMDELFGKMHESNESAKADLRKQLDALSVYTKSTNYQLEQLCDKLIAIKKQNEEILKLLQQREQRFNKNNVVKKFG